MPESMIVRLPSSNLTNASMAAVLPNVAPGAPMPGLARALMQAGRLSATQAETLQKKSVAEKQAFIDVLLSSGTIDSKALAAFCAETFAYPLLDVNALSID